MRRRQRPAGVACRPRSSVDPPAVDGTAAGTIEAAGAEDAPLRPTKEDV